MSILKKAHIVSVEFCSKAIVELGGQRKMMILNGRHRVVFVLERRQRSSF